MSVSDNQALVDAAARLVARDPKHEDLKNFPEAQRISDQMGVAGYGSDDPEFTVFCELLSGYEDEIIARLRSRIAAGDEAALEICADMCQCRGGLLRQELNRTCGSEVGEIWKMFRNEPWDDWLAEAMGLEIVKPDDTLPERAMAAYCLHQAKRQKLPWAIDLARMLRQNSPKQLGLRKRDIVEAFSEALSALNR